MSIISLVKAVRAVAPTDTPAVVYEGEAPSDATLPWIVLNVTLPDSQVSEAGVHTAGTGDLQVTVAALTEDQSIILTDKVLASYRGARVDASGWNVGSLRQVGGIAAFPDTVTVTGTNRRVAVTKTHFAFTCSETGV